MTNKTFSKEEFQAMVAELESEFMNLMKSEQESAQLLAKSEEEAKKEEEKKEEDKSESKEEDKAEKSEEKSESKDEEKKDDEKKDDDESHGYDDEDLEEMHKMYDSMSKGELKAHKNSIEKCWMSKCGEMTQMAKSEETKVETKTKEVKVETKESETETLLKSEIESVKKENEDLKKNLESLVAAMNTFMTKKAPVRKAITDIEFIKKSEEGQNEVKPMTKSEIDTILSKKVVDPSLTRADREAINQFYLTNAGVEKIAHLLKQ